MFRGCKNICQSSSNCILKIMHFITCKLYLKELGLRNYYLDIMSLHSRILICFLQSRWLSNPLCIRITTDENFKNVNSKAPLQIYSTSIVNVCIRNMNTYIYCTHPHMYFLSCSDYFNTAKSQMSTLIIKRIDLHNLKI